MALALNILGSAWRFLLPVGSILSPFATIRNGGIAVAILALLASQVWLYQKGKSSGVRKTIATINKGINKSHERSKKAQARVGNLNSSDVDRGLQPWFRD